MAPLRVDVGGFSGGRPGLSGPANRNRTDSNKTRSSLRLTQVDSSSEDLMLRRKRKKVNFEGLKVSLSAL